MGDPKKKKDGRKMGVYGKCAHQIKKKKMGVPPKKKDGETPIFFLKFFGPHLSPIPTHRPHHKTKFFERVKNR